jgi:hypothetical protein
MSSDSPLPRPDRAHSYYYDDGGRLSEARDVAGNDEFIVATYVYSCALQLPPSFRFGRRWHWAHPPWPPLHKGGERSWCEQALIQRGPESKRTIRAPHRLRQMPPPPPRTLTAYEPCVDDATGPTPPGPPFTRGGKVMV